MLWGFEFKTYRAKSDADGQAMLIGSDWPSVFGGMSQDACDPLFDEILFGLHRPQQSGFVLGEGVGFLQGFAIEDESVPFAQVKFKGQPLQVFGLSKVNPPSVRFSPEGVVFSEWFPGHHELEALIGCIRHMQDQFLGHLHGRHGGDDQPAIGGSAVADGLEVFIEA